MDNKQEWKNSTADQAQYNESKISCMNALFAYVISKEKLEKRKKKLFTKG